MPDEHNEYTERIRALERALLIQESELERAVAINRKHSSKERQQASDTRYANETTTSSSSHASEMVVELNATKEIEQLLVERDMAFDQAA